MSPRRAVDDEEEGAPTARYVLLLMAGNDKFLAPREQVNLNTAKNLVGSNVTFLDLSSNKIGDAGACEIANHLVGSYVTFLDLGSNQISDEKKEELCRY